MKTDTSTLSLKELGDLGYAALQQVQAKMEEQAISDGAARWLTAPHASAARIRMRADSKAAVLVSFRMASEDDLADLSWMAARGYSYALYAGCLDLMKRRAVRVGSRRYIPAGEEQTLQAEIGRVRVSALLAVVEV